jgi:hypothetical protein
MQRQLLLDQNLSLYFSKICFIICLTFMNLKFCIPLAFSCQSIVYMTHFFPSCSIRKFLTTLIVTYLPSITQNSTAMCASNVRFLQNIIHIFLLGHRKFELNILSTRNGCVIREIKNETSLTEK